MSVITDIDKIITYILKVPLEKHKKYAAAYIPNDTYWGLGIEHETYLERSDVRTVTPQDLQSHTDRERYSVAYYNSYKSEDLEQIWSKLPLQIRVPMLINAYTFLKTDIHNEHVTTYEKEPKLNPKFAGQTVLEQLKDSTNPASKFFTNCYQQSFTFDGDTIEFITLNFYKATTDCVLKELKTTEEQFEEALKKQPRGFLRSDGSIQIAKKNYSWASYLTNPTNYGMFNNGTIHINITLPTELDSKGAIRNLTQFVDQHRILIRVLQWLSPMLVAKYGTADPFSMFSDRFAKGSQRIAVSRYIGLGTFDSVKMMRGKMLTMPKKDLPEQSWYQSFYKETAYTDLSDVGLDINFNKHYSHGIEFRILDSMPFEKLSEVISYIPTLMDFSLSKSDFVDPRISTFWNKLAKCCVLKGAEAELDVGEVLFFFFLFGLKPPVIESMRVIDVFDLLMRLLELETRSGFCTLNMSSQNNTQEVNIVAPPTKRWCCCIGW